MGNDPIQESWLGCQVTPVERDLWFRMTTRSAPARMLLVAQERERAVRYAGRKPKERKEILSAQQARQTTPGAQEAQPLNTCPF